VIGNAVHVMRIAAGEVEEAAPVDDGKAPAAKSLGARGGGSGEGHDARAQGGDREAGGGKAVEEGLTACSGFATSNDVSKPEVKNAAADQVTIVGRAAETRGALPNRTAAP